jgi:hypothetical protein
MQFRRAVVLLATLLAGSAQPGLAQRKLPLDSDDLLGFREGLSRIKLYDRCPRLGVLPTPPADLEGADPAVAAQIEAAAVPLFRQAGLVTIDSQSFRSAFEKRNRAEGGIYDPYSGQSLPGKYRAVAAGALHDYLSEQRLDCVVTLRAVRESINVDGSKATWSGAVERVDGQVGDSIFHSSWRGFGSFPVLSLDLRILDGQGTVIFERRGGVQLEAYADVSHARGPNSWLMVPKQSLLKDPKRIERALRYATLPLGYSAEEIDQGRNDPHINTALISPHDLAPPPAGVSPGQEAGGLKVPRPQLLNDIHRVAFILTSDSSLAVPAASLEQFEVLIRDTLKPLEWDVIDARGPTVSELEALGGFYDPFSGVRDNKKDAEVTRLILKLTATPQPDALITVSVLRTSAPQKLGFAEWDGAEQDAITLQPASIVRKVFKGNENRAAGEGLVQASSLRVTLQDAGGRTLFEGRGGIELLEKLSARMYESHDQAGMSQTLTKRPPQELFQDATRNQEAVQIALHELVPKP